MDKYTGFGTDSAGNLITTGTPQIYVTTAGTDTLVPIYSSDSLATPKANPFTLPASGKIEFYARNGKIKVKMVNGAVETPIDDVTMFAGVQSGTFASRPAAGKADVIYVATDTGEIYRDNGTSWEEYPSVGNLANAIGDGALINGTLVATVGSNALTLAVKTLAGADPSAADPVAIVFRSVTPATGDYAVRLLTAATSLVVSNGSNLGVSVNSTPFRGWLVAFDDAGTVRLGVINCLATSAGAGAGRTADSIYPLAQFGIASSTAEGGAGAADSAQVFYTSVAVTSKAYTVLGHFSYETGLATAGAYAAVPTRLERFRTGSLLPGQRVQSFRQTSGAVATGATAIADDDTVKTTASGDVYMTQAITPTSAANVIEAEHVGQYAHSGTVAWVAAMLCVAAISANALSVQEGARDSVANARTQVRLLHRFLAALTSALTCTIRAGNSTGATTTFNGAAAGRKHGGAMGSVLEVSEIMA